MVVGRGGRESCPNLKELSVSKEISIFNLNETFGTGMFRNLL